MFARILLATLVATCFAAAALADDPQVDVDEVLRRGDLIVRTGEGFQAGEASLIEAFTLPQDDSGKWFVLLFTSPNCAPCQQLKQHWQSSKELLAFARPGDPEHSWSHYQELDSTDRTQRWRKYHVNTWPTVVIQPPLNGHYGDASTIVFQQSGYDGDPAKLAGAMRSAIQKYVARLQSPGFGQPGGRYSPPDFPQGPQPFFPPASPLQIPPGPVPATLEQLKAACPGADAEFLLSQLQAQASVEQAQAAWQLKQPGPKLPTFNLTTGLLSLLGIGNLGGLVILGLVLLRKFRQASGKQILDDQQFDALVKRLAQLLGTTPAAAKRGR